MVSWMSKAREPSEAEEQCLKKATCFFKIASRRELQTWKEITFWTYLERTWKDMNILWVLWFAGPWSWLLVRLHAAGLVVATQSKRLSIWERSCEPVRDGPNVTYRNSWASENCLDLQCEASAYRVYRDESGHIIHHQNMLKVNWRDWPALVVLLCDFVRSGLCRGSTSIWWWFGWCTTGDEGSGFSFNCPWQLSYR